MDLIFIGNPGVGKAPFLSHCNDVAVKGQMLRIFNNKKAILSDKTLGNCVLWL